MFSHGMDGVVFTLIYAIAIFPLLTRVLGGSLSATANMAKGFLYGAVLAGESYGPLSV